MVVIKICLKKGLFYLNIFKDNFNWVVAIDLDKFEQFTKFVRNIEEKHSSIQYLNAVFQDSDSFSHMFGLSSVMAYDQMILKFVDRFETMSTSKKLNGLGDMDSLLNAILDDNLDSQQKKKDTDSLVKGEDNIRGELKFEDNTSQTVMYFLTNSSLEANKLVLINQTAKNFTFSKNKAEKMFALDSKQNIAIRVQVELIHQNSSKPIRNNRKVLVPVVYDKRNINWEKNAGSYNPHDGYFHGWIETRPEKRRDFIYIFDDLDKRPEELEDFITLEFYRVKISTFAQIEDVILGELVAAWSEEKLIENFYTNEEVQIISRKDPAKVSKLKDLLTYHTTGGYSFELKRNYNIWDSLTIDLKNMIRRIKVIKLFRSELGE